MEKSISYKSKERSEERVWSLSKSSNYDKNAAVGLCSTVSQKPHTTEGRLHRIVAIVVLSLLPIPLLWPTHFHILSPDFIY